MCACALQEFLKDGDTTLEDMDPNQISSSMFRKLYVGSNKASGSGQASMHDTNQGLSASKQFSSPPGRGRRSSRDTCYNVSMFGNTASFIVVKPLNPRQCESAGSKITSLFGSQCKTKGYAAVEKGAVGYITALPGVTCHTVTTFANLI